MKTPYRIPGTGLLGLTLLCFAAVSAYADPLPLAPPTKLPLPANPPAPAKNPLVLPADKAPEPVPHVLGNLTLDYESATQNSAEVLNSKVTVTFKDASFLAALDAVMDASAKTCRIECRQLSPLRLSMKVKEVPVAGLLDSLAKLGGARLFVLPSKLILAPESALTDDEKKKAKPYGVLLTATTLPNTPDAKALTQTDGKTFSILDIANARISRRIKNVSLDDLLEGGVADPYIGPFRMVLLGPISGSDLADRSLNIELHDVRFGDALSSFARSIGCELYMTPGTFVICSPDKLAGHNFTQWTHNAVPAFQPNSTTFTDPSANGS